MSTLKLKGSSSGEAEVTVAAAAGTPTFTLPTTVGSASQLLKNSGTAGTLQYASIIEDSSGRVGIGTNNTAKNNHSFLNVHRATSDSNYMYFTNTTTGETGGDGFTIGIDGDEKALLWNRENTDMRFGTNGTERLTIAAAGDVTLQTGNLVIGTSGKGIDFSATSDATGMSSELFDDYEEGVFTATCDNSVTLHAANDTLVYTKVGRLVTVQGQVRVNGSNGNSSFVIENLPFVSAEQTDGGEHAVGAVRGWDWNLPSGVYSIICLTSGGTSNLEFWNNKDDTGAGETPADGHGYVAFSITYMAAT